MKNKKLLIYSSNMPENTKTAEFLQKLAPCIKRSDLDVCVEEAARVAREMGAGELLKLTCHVHLFIEQTKISIY
jgi:hypothetical protein